MDHSEDGRKDEPDDRQGHHVGRHPGIFTVEMLDAMAHPAQELAEAHGQQQRGQDRAGDGCRPPRGGPGSSVISRISSVALPKVALISPPSLGPVKCGAPAPRCPR